jgi:nucleotide-binding universal stress UspA family protein
MKLLIAYDGSAGAESAIDDLSASGLPVTGNASVLSVAEVRLPPASAIEEPADLNSMCIQSIVEVNRKKGERMLSEASIRARHAETRVKAALPGWQVTSQAVCGSPVREILAKAQDEATDMIVVGSHGHSGLGRMVLGSISQTLLSESECSVRVSRGTTVFDSAPGKVLIGYDGSRGASAAVFAVAGRAWKRGTKVMLLAVTEPRVPLGIGRFMRPLGKAVESVSVIEDEWIVDLARPALERLGEAGLDACFRIHSGNPKQVLVQAAESWGADCIFVGANAWGGPASGIQIGTTASAVASRATCSVEVVRVPAVCETMR